MKEFDLWEEGFVLFMTLYELNFFVELSHFLFRLVRASHNTSCFTIELIMVWFMNAIHIFSCFTLGDFLVTYIDVAM